MKTIVVFLVVSLGFLLHTIHTSQTSRPTPATKQKSRIAIYCMDEEEEIYCHSKGKKTTAPLVKRYEEWNESKNTTATCRDLVKFHGEFCSIKTPANTTTVSSIITASTTEESTKKIHTPTKSTDINQSENHSNCTSDLNTCIQEKKIIYDTVVISVGTALILLSLSLVTLLKYICSLRQKLAKSVDNFAITQQFLKAALEKNAHKNDAMEHLLEEQNQDENNSVGNLSTKRDIAVQTECNDDAITDDIKFDIEELMM